MRIVIAIILAALIGGIGYYFGRQSLTPAVEETSRSRAKFATPRPETTVPPEPNPGTPPPIDTGRGAGPAPVPAPEAAAPAPGTQPRSGAPEADSGVLAARDLGLPIANLAAQDIHDTFNQARGNGERRHEAADIMAPKGTPVLAVESGLIHKLFTSKAGGLTIYQMDPQEKYLYYYAHLDGYAPGLREGLLVRKGDVIGYVGVTGNSAPNAPHLHFAIFELGPEKKWYSDLRPVNPYPLLMGTLQKQDRRSAKR